MSSIFISSAIFSIWFAILFVGKSIGLSMLIFVVPFTYYLLSVLEKNNKEVNGKARVLIVPITLLAGTYLIFNNQFLNILNSIVIPILVVIMVVSFIDKKLSTKLFGVKVLETIFMPIDFLGETIYKLEETIEEKLKINPNKTKNKSNMKILKGICITIPLALVVLVLLVSADEVFASFFIDLFDGIIETIMKLKLYDISLKIVVAMLMFLYLSAFLFTLINKYDREDELQQELKMKDDTTIKIVLSTLNIIYLFFCIIQIRSLFSGDLGVNYSQYARQGFFQLVIVSIINLVTILIAKSNDNKEKNRFNFVNIMCLLMIVFTFIILISSAMRMYYYENAFGYTLLRLLVYCVLITEAILLIPTILYVLDFKIKLAKSYFIVIVTMYICMNFANLDNLIAKRNVERYIETGKIDVEYLLNNTKTDATGQIVRIFEIDEYDDNVKIQIYKYLEVLDEELDEGMDFRDFNISKKNAKSIIEDVIE